MTVLDLLSEALTVCGIIGQGNPTPSDQLANVAFQKLVGLIDTSNADPLRELTTRRYSFLLTPGQQAYTIGLDSSLDINQPRPSRILRANLMDTGAFLNPIYSKIRVLQWSEYQQWGVRASP